MLAKIDSHVRKHLTRDAKNLYNHYVKKVNWIIHERYNTKLIESEIARELGISVGYLCSMYKKYTEKHSLVNEEHAFLHKVSIKYVILLPING